MNFCDILAILFLRKLIKIQFSYKTFEAPSEIGLRFPNNNTMHVLITKSYKVTKLHKDDQIPCWTGIRLLCLVFFSRKENMAYCLTSQALRAER